MGERLKIQMVTDKNRKTGKTDSRKNGRSKKRKRPSPLRWIIPLGAAAVIVAGVLGFVLSKPAPPQTNSQVEEGVQHLKDLESRDLDAIETNIKMIRQEARAEALANGTLSVWAQFSDYVLFGDSRTVGFYFYEFLDQNRVLADGGLTIRDLTTYMDRLKMLNPSALFLCTGLNDVSIGYWETPQEYVAEYEELIEQVMAELPDTHIYINSIFPAVDPAFEQSEAWRNIPDYNVALQAWCEEKGYSFIDNTPVFEEHRDLYDPDGIHFQKEFYEYWAINMLAGMET